MEHTHFEIPSKVAVCVRAHDHRNSYNHGDTNLNYGLVTWTKSYSAGEQKTSDNGRIPSKLQQTFSKCVFCECESIVYPDVYLLQMEVHC
jgi:hypothetical protein